MKHSYHSRSFVKGLSAAVVVLFASFLPAPASAAAAQVIGEVAYVVKSVEIKATANAKWGPAKVGQTISEGAEIKTGAGSRIELKLVDGSALRLGPKSHIELEKAKFNGNGQKEFSARLIAGKAWAAVTKLFGFTSFFQVKTANAVAGVRGTQFAAALGQDGSSQVKVYSGQVLVSNKPIYAKKGATKENRVEVAGPQEVSKKAWTELVASAMQYITVSAAGKLSQAQPFKVAELPTDREWETWNLERDKLAGLGE